MPIDDYIDFPVADCWRDHYAAQGLTYPSGRKPRSQAPPPRLGFSDEDYSQQQKINDLLATIKRQREEISSLKAQLHPEPKTKAFEGAE